MYAEIAAHLGAPRSAVRGELNAMNEQTLAKTGA
jgi:DNA-binding IclR family transcriptional regulator